MSELHKFLFDGLPVRGMIVRLTDAWTELLRRRAANTETGPYPAPVSELLGEMAAAGVLIQRMPLKGEANLAGGHGREDEDQIGRNEDYNRIATLASSLTREELLTLDVDTILRRLFWEEKLLRFAPQQGDSGPRFACSCSRERVGNMLRSLGTEEVESILEERGNIEVGCEYCGQQYHFDPVDAAQLFTDPHKQPPAPSRMQ